MCGGPADPGSRSRPLGGNAGKPAQTSRPVASSARTSTVNRFCHAPLTSARRQRHTFSSDLLTYFISDSTTGFVAYCL